LTFRYIETLTTVDGHCFPSLKMVQLSVKIVRPNGKGSKLSTLHPTRPEAESMQLPSNRGPGQAWLTEDGWSRRLRRFVNMTDSFAIACQLGVSGDQSRWAMGDDAPTTHEDIMMVHIQTRRHSHPKAPLRSSAAIGAVPAERRRASGVDIIRIVSELALL